MGSDPAPGAPLGEAQGEGRGAPVAVCKQVAEATFDHEWTERSRVRVVWSTVARAGQLAAEVVIDAQLAEPTSLEWWPG